MVDLRQAHPWIRRVLATENVLEREEVEPFANRREKEYVRRHE